MERTSYCTVLYSKLFSGATCSFCVFQRPSSCNICHPFAGWSCYTCITGQFGGLLKPPGSQPIALLRYYTLTFLIFGQCAHYVISARSLRYWGQSELLDNAECPRPSPNKLISSTCHVSNYYLLPSSKAHTSSSFSSFSSAFSHSILTATALVKTAAHALTASRKGALITTRLPSIVSTFIMNRLGTKTRAPWDGSFHNRLVALVA